MLTSQGTIILSLCTRSGYSWCPAQTPFTGLVHTPPSCWVLAAIDSQLLPFSWITVSWGEPPRPRGCLPSPPLLAAANNWQPAYKRSAPWPPFMFQHAAASPQLSPHPCLAVSAFSSLLSSLPFSWELSLSRLLLQESLSQTWLLQNPN